MKQFLQASQVIDWTHSDVMSKAEELSSGVTGPEDIARRCFEWVRDEIQHSFDFKRNPVTCCASEVLSAKTGYCYAKSHLLAAFLRASGIPAGFCYQRLSIDDKTAPFRNTDSTRSICPKSAGIGWIAVATKLEWTPSSRHQLNG